jgi:hypothetical protein
MILDSHWWSRNIEHARHVLIFNEVKLLARIAVEH